MLCDNEVIAFLATLDPEAARRFYEGWRVDDIASKVNELMSRGVVFERFEGMPQSSSGVWTSPTGAQVAWFKDPDGNALSLTQFKA